MPSRHHLGRKLQRAAEAKKRLVAAAKRRKAKAKRFAKAAEKTA